MSITRSLIVGLIVVGASDGQAPAAQPDPALTFLRIVNTLQADAIRTGTGVIPLADLLADSTFTPLRSQLVIAAEGVSLGEHRVTFVRSADGREYQVGVVPPGRCGPAWFSSQTGLIYRGQPLGCP